MSHIQKVLRSCSRPPCGFTLIELVVVIGVIVTLMALFAGYTSKLRDRARIASCQRLISSVATALESYKMDFKQYPPSTFGTYSANQALTYFLTSAFSHNPNPQKGEVQASINAGPYLQLQPTDLVDLSAGAGRLSIVDPWQTPISYQLVKQQNHSVWDTTQTITETLSIPIIYSFGPNKVSDTTIDPTTGAITKGPYCDDVMLDTHN